jgi:hypothetical protein
MFIRFAITQKECDSSRGSGIFQVASQLRDSEELYEHEHNRIRELLDWFNTHLEKPSRFTASKPPYYRKQQRAISWFKDSANTHISKARELAAIIEDQGIAVQAIMSNRVGYIVYEDAYQVVAEPFADVNC